MAQAVMRHAGPGILWVPLELTIAPGMPVRPLPGILRVPLALTIAPGMPVMSQLLSGR